MSKVTQPVSTQEETGTQDHLTAKPMPILAGYTTSRTHHGPLGKGEALARKAGRYPGWVGQRLSYKWIAVGSPIPD